MIPISCQAILFDLDGTLIDSWKCIEYAWTTWCSEHNLEYRDLVHRFNGTRAVDIVRTLKPDLDPEEEKVKINALELSHSANISPISGSLDILKTIPREKWGIVTSGSHSLVTEKLKQARISIPDVLITADHITRGKPDPQGYSKAASLLNVAPDQCLVFEDAPQGIKAARNAGMKVIALTTTFPMDALTEAYACIDNYKCLDVSLNNSEITISLRL